MVKSPIEYIWDMQKLIEVDSKRVKEYKNKTSFWFNSQTYMYIIWKLKSILWHFWWWDIELQTFNSKIKYQILAEHFASTKVSSWKISVFDSAKPMTLTMPQNDNEDVGAG